MTIPPPASIDEASRRHWRRLRRCTGALLAVWAVLTFAGVFFARDLRFTMFGWPFGFWLAAQGAVIGYVLIVVAYAAVARRLDQTWQADAAERREG